MMKKFLVSFGMDFMRNKFTEEFEAEYLTEAINEFCKKNEFKLIGVNNVIQKLYRLQEEIVFQPNIYRLEIKDKTGVKYDYYITEKRRNEKEN